MARNAIESDFRSSKMAAGGHFKNKINKNLRIYLKWREIRSKVIFGHPKMAGDGHFSKKNSPLFPTFRHFSPLFFQLFPTFHYSSPLFPTFPHFFQLFPTFHHFSPLLATFSHFSLLFTTFPKSCEKCDRK